MDYLQVKEQIKQKLSNPIDFKDTENLLELGLSSLVIMRLVNQWRKQGIKVSFGSLMEHPTFQEWWGLIQNAAKKTTPKKSKSSKEKIDTGDMYQEFPLTDVQYAYWVGRDDGQALGGVGCHAYLEFDGESVDPERLQSAWNIVQYHHSMLRDCFPGNGLQKIMSKPYSEKIRINDFASLSESEAEKAALSVRDRLSHRKLQIEKGEVAGIELTRLTQRKTRVHIDIDLLVADVQSLHIILRDLATAYNGGHLPDESKDWNFAAYLQEQEEEESDEREQAKAYWKKRLDVLPKGPELPMAKRPEEIRQPIFKRRIVRIGKKEWERLQARAKEYKTTPAMLLLTAYATVLERWSQNKRFLINIPYFNRNTEKQGLEEVVADFTTLLLLEVNCEGTPTFLELLHRIEKQLHEDMKHTAYSGVQVQRDLSRIYGESAVSAPVVFACNLGAPLIDSVFQKSFGEFSYMISQTPQVWNDFQSYEDEKGVQLTWDSVDELFPQNMIQEMIESFNYLLIELENVDWNQNFDMLPRSRQNDLTELSKLCKPEETFCIQDAFLKNEKSNPMDIALIDTGKNLVITYQQLKKKAAMIAATIIEKEIRKVPIAITLPRGHEQIEAVLGVLMSGNIYVPVSVEQPEDRRRLIHEKTGIDYVITNKNLKKRIKWPDNTRIFALEDMNVEKVDKFPIISPEDSAYIIMTSGSTGIPKGVEIAHGSAWNTIQDINAKYYMRKTDKLLAISALDFDLSVYDIFGILGSGGTLVLLPESEQKNPEFWLKQIVQYHITVWNSAPMLLDMLLVQAEIMKQNLPLRIAMLSGDWIGMDLPERLNKFTQDCEFIAMGGATEASIWSNYQKVNLPIPEYWKSIPYGRPLSNQAYRVVDENGRDCPCWVNGELWIGGYGIAKGYRGDDDLSRKKFIEDAYGRWYKTGDLGCLWADGTIEFLGRKDNCIKIRGHRIELGEIEANINSIKGVERSVVINSGGSLIAFYNTYKILKNTKSKFYPNEILENTISETLQEINALGIWIIVSFLVKSDCFKEREETYFYSELYERCRIIDPYSSLFDAWLKILVKTEVLQYDQGKYYCLGSLIDICSELTKKIEHSASSKLVIKQLYELVSKNVNVIYSIIQGEYEPAYIFEGNNYELFSNNLEPIVGSDRSYIHAIEETIKKKFNNCEKKLKILEIGGYTGNIISNYKFDVSKYIQKYTYLLARNSKLNEYLNVNREIEIINSDLDDELFIYKCGSNEYDLVIVHQSLHCSNNINKAMELCLKVLKTEGTLICVEPTCNNLFFTVVLGFLENRFSEYTDGRAGHEAILFNNSQLINIANEIGLVEKQKIEYKTLDKKVMYIWEKKYKTDLISEEKLVAILNKKLPYYMIPEFFIELDEIPLLKNGKIDRKKVFGYLDACRLIKKNGTLAKTNTEKLVVEELQKILKQKNIFMEDNFFLLGGDSLRAIKFKNSVLQLFGVNISISQIFESSTIKELSEKIDECFSTNNCEYSIIGEI